MEFRKLSPAEMTNIETRLRSKRAKYKVKDGVVKMKAGNKEGKTEYIVNDEMLAKLDKKNKLTILEFCKLYNNELSYLGQQGLYTKIVRDKTVLNYLYNKNFLEVKEFERGGKPYTKYWVKSGYKQLMLDFLVEFLSPKLIDNENDIRNLIKTNPNAIKNPEKLDESANFKSKTGRIKKF